MSLSFVLLMSYALRRRVVEGNHRMEMAMALKR